MAATSSLAKKLARSYPSITFVRGDYAHWAPRSQTVFFDPNEGHADWILLHETAHALLNHRDYVRDIELLKLERAAWDYATSTLAKDHGVEIDPDFVESHLDTYREWLHAKSTCPHCQSNGLEQAKHHYLCLHCGSTWRTNTGTTSSIRRYILNN